MLRIAACGVLYSFNYGPGLQRLRLLEEQAAKCVRQKATSDSIEDVRSFLSKLNHC